MHDSLNAIMRFETTDKAENIGAAIASIEVSSLRLVVGGGRIKNVPTWRLTVDAVPRIGIDMRSHVPPMLAGLHSLLDALPRVINTVRAADEAAHIRADTFGDVAIVDAETAYALSFDRNMPLATRLRLYDGGNGDTHRHLVTNASFGVRRVVKQKRLPLGSLLT